jgi:metal-responsive CopG/Arc/MetJ family transcriptional regulator
VGGLERPAPPSGIPQSDLAFWYNFYYTSFMKTAISIPDALFKRAERTAKAIGVSRSRFFALAVESFIAHQNPALVTETLNRVYADSADGLDGRISRMQAKSVERETW